MKMDGGAGYFGRRPDGTPMEWLARHDPQAGGVRLLAWLGESDLPEHGSVAELSERLTALMFTPEELGRLDGLAVEPVGYAPSQDGRSAVVVQVLVSALYVPGEDGG